MTLIKGILALTIVGSMSIGFAEASTCTPGSSSTKVESSSSSDQASQDVDAKDHFSDQKK